MSQLRTTSLAPASGTSAAGHPRTAGSPARYLNRLQLSRTQQAGCLAIHRQCASNVVKGTASPRKPSLTIIARSSGSPDPSGSEPDNGGGEEALQLLVDYATAGTLAAIIGWGTNTPALGAFHPDPLDAARVMLLLAPIYALDVAMMVPDFRTAASLRTLAELEPGVPVVPGEAQLQGKRIVFDSWAAYYRFLLDGNQVDCIVNDPCINVPIVPRVALVALSALSEEMLFRGVLVALLAKGLSLGILQAGLEELAPAGASGTGAVAAAVLFASLIALVPLAKVQNVLRDLPTTEVLVQESDGEATGLAALRKAWMLSVPPQQQQQDAAGSSSSSSSSRSDDRLGTGAAATVVGGAGAGLGSDPVERLAIDASPGSNGVLSAGSNGVLSAGSNGVLSASGRAAAKFAVNERGAGQTASSGMAREGVVFRVQSVNPAAVFKGVQGVRNVVEVLLLNLGFVLTGNLAASFVANVTMQVLFSLYQYGGEQRMKAEAK